MIFSAGGDDLSVITADYTTAEAFTRMKIGDVNGNAPSVTEIYSNGVQVAEFDGFAAVPLTYLRGQVFHRGNIILTAAGS
jgi:hypothetical protein